MSTTKMVEDLKKLPFKKRRAEVLKRLRELKDDQDFEVAHGTADRLLLGLLNDDEVEEAWEAIGKWFA